ncbi:MAG: tRNA (adenosine(37)-N6)-threonylcarbamoyltransferase complex transferase subunit TsaD [Patescibacteria group bacterium]
MTILGIETSCDDTAIAILKIRGKKFEILSNVVASQVNLHQKYGGVYPTLAKREHQKNLPIVLEKALKKTKNPKIDLIAVTIGPGLEPCLWTGINFAKDLSKKWKLPLIPINHIEAHIFANFVGKEPKTNFFPAICLVVSGGHTQLILMKNIGSYKIIGETRDDAAGECFDKTARILGLEYPGGPAIAKQVKKLKNTNYKLITNLPRPMIHQKNYDFSFSGLKTAVLYDFKSRPEKVRKSKLYIKEMCNEIQQAIIDVLISKTLKAAKDFKAKTIILGGGVSANNELRKQFKVYSLESKVEFLVPPKKLCTDNAVMIATSAYFYWLKNKELKPETIEANANLRL